MSGIIIAAAAFGILVVGSIIVAMYIKRVNDNRRSSRKSKDNKEGVDLERNPTVVGVESVNIRLDSEGERFEPNPDRPGTLTMNRAPSSR